MNYRLTALLLLVSFADAASAEHTGPYPSPAEQTWPVSASASPDMPFSSTFGPRLRASDGFRYDWHRGVDIPVPCSTPLRAIADGFVRIAGDHSSFSDRVVQLCHPKPGQPDSVCGDDDDLDGFLDDDDGDGDVDRTSANAWYSNYLHMESATVTLGAPVARGAIIGTSGESGIGDTGTCHPDDGPDPQGFDHLHFEIRDGGVRQLNTVHPLLLLPYADSGAPAVTIDEADLTDPLNPRLTVTVTTPPDETDLNVVEVIVFDRSGGVPVEIDRHTWNIMEWTFAYTGNPTDIAVLDTAPEFDGIYDDVATFGDDAGVIVAPAKYNASSSEYSIAITFTSLSGLADPDDLSFTVRAIDVRGNETSTSSTPGGVAGDVNGDGVVSVADIFYLINHLFASGPPPVGDGDVNGDSSVSVADIFYLINFLFASGPAPADA